MRFHRVQYLYNMKTLRKKLWTHFPGSAPGPLTIKQNIKHAYIYEGLQYRNQQQITVFLNS